MHSSRQFLSRDSSSRNSQAKSLRRRQSLGVSSPANQKKKAPKKSITPRAKRNRLPSYLKPGSAVEISSDEVEFRGSWYAGSVVTTSSSDKNSGKVQVEYTTLFFDKEGQKRLREVVDMAQLRPPAPPMSEREKKKDFAVGEVVDAFHNDGWWEGDVTEVLGDGQFSVFFRGTREQIRYSKDQLRLHREWVNGAWKPPLDEPEEEESEEDKGDDTEDEESLLSLVDPETARAVAKEMFSTGTLVEVSSDEEGFKGCWFVAKVIEPIGEDKYLVEYRDLREEDGIEPLKEEIDFLHIRPPPPSEEDIDFAVGNKVDAFYNDGWWAGHVIESMHDGRIGIFFKESGEKIRIGRQGLRLHKVWVNGTWQLPLKGGEIKRAKKVSCDRNVRPKNGFDKQYISIGTPVEVSSIEEGFEDSWFLAKLIEYRGTDKCLVEYDKLKAEDGKEPLREEVDVFQIRPQPPEMVVVNPFEKLDKVDALYNDGWWVGSVKKILAKSSYLVYFSKNDEVLKFHHSQLRLHQEWIDGNWITSSKSQTV
ncbi:hypothetical protein EUTSA_v10009728mg [Eutrema salsugineum]|uniref:Agenet domain-containing protein n=1 Tax=Eutrema salsugineum TaxID=72664 RepID=V4L0U3_EUTSA|nr:DUF724 domain-containing protein 3 [Eutrema salsugineum]ESQ35937.1 hypothetical protein EUTSA_v10009728mg [Eutrema salsugineum]